MQIIRQQNAIKSHFFDYSLWNHYVNVHFNHLSVPIESTISCTFLVFLRALLHIKGRLNEPEKLATENVANRKRNIAFAMLKCQIVNSL